MLNASMRNRATGRNISRMSLWRIALQYTNLRVTRHIFLSMVRKCASPLISCTQNPIDQLPADIHEFVSARKIQFQKAYDSARSALNFNQKRRNAVYNRKVHEPSHQVDQKVLLHNTVVPVGKLNKVFSPWKGPYVILQNLNDGTYRIHEIARQKVLIVHYDRLKLFHEPPPTSNVPTRDRRNPKNVSPLSPRQHKQILPEFDHHQFTWQYPHRTVFSATT